MIVYGVQGGAYVPHSSLGYIPFIVDIPYVGRSWMTMFCHDGREKDPTQLVSNLVNFEDVYPGTNLAFQLQPDYGGDAQQNFTTLVCLGLDAT
jgi:hypothetical protein